MSYIIATDTSSNLTKEILDKYKIGLVPFTFYPQNQPDKEASVMAIEEFDGSSYYDSIRKGQLYNTSQITPQIFVDEFSKYADQGLDVLFISMSSGISGSYNSSLIAKKQLEETYPDRKFLMFDSLAASLGEGIAVLKAVEYQQQGLSIEDNYNSLLILRKHIYQVFTVEDLKHLKRTGRLSNAELIIGTVLHIRPILKGNDAGKIITTTKVRGNKNAIKTLANKYIELVKNPEEQIVGIAHSDNQEDADLLKSLIMNSKPPKEVLTVCYEPVTGSHVGPSTIALFFLGDEDVRNK